MGERVKVTGTISKTTDGSNVPGDRGEIALDFSGSGDVFADVRGRASYPLSTAGAVGAVYASLDVPPTVYQLAIVSKLGSEVGVRLNGAVARLPASSPSYGTIANGEQVQLNVDQAGNVTVTFLTGDITATLVAQRINAALGAIVATVDATTGNVVLAGAKTGGAAAASAGRQYGSVQVVGGNAATKLGLAVGTTYGAGSDFSVTRLLLDFPRSGSNTVTKVEVSGSGEIVTHAAGQ